MDKQCLCRLHHVPLQLQIHFQRVVQLRIVLRVVGLEPPQLFRPQQPGLNLTAAAVQQIVQSVVLKMVIPQHTAAGFAAPQRHAGLGIAVMQIGKAGQLRTDAHAEQTLPQNIGQAAENGRRGGLGRRQVDHHRNVLAVQQGAALGDLGFDISKETRRGDIAHLGALRRDFQHNIGVVDIPGQIPKMGLLVLIVHIAAVQGLGQKPVQIAVQGPPQQLLVGQAQGQHLREVRQMEIVAFPQGPLQLIHADAAVVPVTVPQIGVQNPIAPDGRRKHGHTPLHQGTQIFLVQLELVDQVQGHHVPPGTGLLFPVEHTLHPPGTGQDIKVRIVDKDGILKNLPADLQHFD